MILSTSDRFHVALPDPGDPDLDGSDVFFSAGENEDIDVLDDNLVTENDKFDIDRACRGAGGTVDDEPDAEFQPDGNGVCQGMKEVVQLRVGLNRETLVEVLEIHRDQLNHRFPRLSRKCGSYPRGARRA